MCTRYTLSASPPEVADYFGLADVPDLAPRYNVAPSQAVACVRGDRRSRRLTFLRWGLVPPWANDLKIGHHLLNARSETVAEKPAFRSAFQRRRCLIPADGFYQWEHRGSTKAAYHVRLRDRSLFGMAGLWENWTDLFGETLQTCCVITTAERPPVRLGQNRMPVLIDPRDFGRWLDAAEPIEDLVRLLRGEPAGEFEAAPASPLVNNVRNDGPHLLSAFGFAPEAAVSHIPQD